MTDPTPTAPAPRLSQETIDQYAGYLNDPKFLIEHPAHHAMLRANVDAALALTGQSLTPPSDGRTPAEAHADRNFGMERKTAADFPGIDATHLPLLTALRVDRHMGAAIAADLAAAKVNPPSSAAIRAQLDTMKRPYTKTMDDAAAALKFAGSDLKPSDLPIRSLIFLANHGQTIERWKAARGGKK